MKKEKYQVPRIFVCKVEAQPVLASSDPNVHAGIGANQEVTYGDDDDVWETVSGPEN